MMGGTHALVGAVGGLVIAHQLQPEPTMALAMVAAGALGGLLPDVDHPNGSINQRFPLLRLFTFWIPHRTYTHSIWLGALVMLLGTISPVGMALGVGYLLHIAADMMTYSGVPLFCPVWRGRCYLLPRPLRLQTGGLMEQGLRLALASATLVVFWGEYGQHLQGLF